MGRGAVLTEFTLSDAVLNTTALVGLNDFGPVVAVAGMGGGR